MTEFRIPSLLKKKLRELDLTASQQPLFVEVGDGAFSVATERAKLIATPLEALAKTPSVLLLLPPEQVEALLKESPSCEAFICLSERQSPRADLSALRDESKILVTTPQRTIDHLRRDNIFLEKTETVILGYDFLKGEKESMEQLLTRERAFLDDCRFIFTKISEKTKIEFFIDTLSHLTRTPQELVDDPLIILKGEWEQSQFKIECYTSDKIANKQIVTLLYALHHESYLLIHKIGSRWNTLMKELALSSPSLSYQGLAYSEELPGDLKSAGCVVTIGLKEREIASTVRYLHEHEKMVQRVVCIVTPKEVEQIITSKETLLMNHEIKSIPQNKEVIAGKIQMLLAKLSIDSEPEELESLRLMIKKNVPLMRRGYFSAYLLRELFQTEGGTPKLAKKSDAPKAAAVKAKPATDSRTLYLNIGKMRRLYAKELSQIFQDKLSINKDEIYSIRIHDKYSFITLSQKNADRAIELMNGMEIRGRVAVISYSNRE
ncbi:MAG: DbpA RNA binding domain-containing protein [Sphaerochaetaceae bacterium]